MSGGGLQPHRKGSPLRMPGEALSAMQRGTDAHGQNPANLRRMAQKGQQQVSVSSRPPRPPRAARPPRSPR